MKDIWATLNFVLIPLRAENFPCWKMGGWVVKKSLLKIQTHFYYIRQISVDILTSLSFWVELRSAVKLPSTHYDTWWLHNEYFDETDVEDLRKLFTTIPLCILLNLTKLFLPYYRMTKHLHVAQIVHEYFHHVTD